jgi:formylglycine-generating enzyme required for sulfatase activity
MEPDLRRGYEGYFIPVDTVTLSNIHLIYLDSYWIDRYEVTLGAYSQCFEQGPCRMSTEWGDSLYADCSISFNDNFPQLPDKEKYPINCLSWYQAKTYCEWVGKRLPTLFEWTKAARGPYPDMRKYPWGNNEPTCATIKNKNSA